MNTPAIVVALCGNGECSPLPLWATITFAVLLVILLGLLVVCVRELWRNR